MKVSKTFRLSEEAVEVLNAKPNATEFLEQLILNQSPAPASSGLTRAEVIQLIEQHAPKQPEAVFVTNVPKTVDIPGVVKGADFVPKPPDPEKGYPCCQGKRPCKHWVWDEGTGEGYINTITGEVRAA